VATFEYPLNERIRILLRLEHLFAKFLQNFESAQSLGHHHAMLNLFQIIDVMDRGDLKNDLLIELDKQRVNLAYLENQPKVDKQRLSDTLQNLKQICEQLRSATTRPVHELKQNDWLMNLKQRAIIPGGLCQFDVPAYHLWLRLQKNLREADLQLWINPLMPTYEATKILLEMLRGAADAEAKTATNGAFMQMLNTNKVGQMLKIEIQDELSCYPEISANKYAIHIRFLQMTPQQQATPCNQDIPFKLSLACL